MTSPSSPVSSASPWEVPPPATTASPSCIRHLGEQFVRARLGIGPKKHPGQDLADHVLGRLPDADLAILTQRIPDFIKHLETLLSQGLPAAQNLTNRKSPSP
jgi:PTH1 family peptidyl-tRNA hydrolase